MAQPSISTQPFPQLSTPVVAEGGFLAVPWQRLLQNLWIRAGGSNVNNQTIVYLTQTGSNPNVNVNSTTGEMLGQLEFTGQAGQPAVAVPVGASPFVYDAPSAGAVAVESGQVEISRDSGVNFFVIGLAGGLIPVRAADQIRLTYYRDVPAVHFLPD